MFSTKNACCVVNCNSRREDVKLHKFPKDETGLQKWLQCINTESLKSLTSTELQKLHVCHKHFEKKWYISPATNSRIRMNAYPTLFSIEEIREGVPLVATTCATTDHDYTFKKMHQDHTYCQSWENSDANVEELNKSMKRSIVKDHSYSKGYCTTEKRQRIEFTPSASLKNQVIVTSNLDMVVTEKSASLSNAPSTSFENRPITPSNLNLKEAHQFESLTTGIILNSPPRIKTKRRHIIFTEKSLTPNCKKLYKEYTKSRKQLNFKNRAKRALKFCKSKNFEKLTENINPMAKKVLWMQIKQAKKKAKGRRFSEEEKLIALAIMKQSPKCYKFLQKIFILPGKQTLNKMISELRVEAGINPQILDAIKQEVNTWVENKKYCTLLFDEVALEAALTYDKHKDCIDGLVELGTKTSDFADHALVFMLRGAIHKWQQPLAFYFCKGATSGTQLKCLIKELVAAVSDTGLLPIALACDQGTAFQAAIKSLQDETREKQIRSGGKLIDDVIEINENTLNVIYDPPHLIKGLRNNFLTKNIKYNNKISQWGDIVDVYKTDCSHAQMRLLHKLNDEHVIPEKIKKMKVKNCTKVLSKTVAATLAYTAQFSHYSDGRPTSATLNNTAEVVSFFDDLFDSVNGASTINKRGKLLRQAVTDKSSHHIFWNEALDKLKNIKFVNSNGKETSVPSLKNFMVTIKSYQRLWQFFKKKNIKIMRPRYFNSDPIENFFGQVRAYNFRNNDPSFHTFKSTFRSLLITRFIKFHTETFNCEEDSGEQILKLKSLFKKDNKKVPPSIILYSHESHQDSNINIESSATVNEERLRNHCSAYTAGWVVRKVLKNSNCKRCKSNLTTANDITEKFDRNSLNNFINYKEFQRNRNRLTYPSENSLNLFRKVINFSNKKFEVHPHDSNILEKIKITILDSDETNFLDCEPHKEAVAVKFISLTLKLNVFNWCNIINRILKGTDVFRLRNKDLPHMQAKAYKKYQTKLKNKRINK